MSTDTLHGTAALNKPSAFDRYLSTVVLAGTQDREYLRGLAPGHRDRTVQAFSDLDVHLQSSSVRESDAARERLTQACASQWWRPFNPDVMRALEERAQVADRKIDDVKLEAMQVGLFLALKELPRVQKVQLGQTRDKVVVDDGILVSCSSDGSVRDWAAGLAHEGHFQKLLRPRSAIMAAFLGYDSWMRDAKDCVWATFVGPTRPVELREERRLHWLRRRAIKHAEEWILDGSLSGNSDVLAISDLDLGDLSQSPLDALVNVEEQSRRLREVFDLATPRQRQILDVLDRLMRSGLDIPDAKRLAAAELGIQVGAIDTALSRLRTRVAAANRL